MIERTALISDLEWNSDVREDARLFYMRYITKDGVYVLSPRREKESDKEIS